ncbi:period circadian protein homolog 1b isoform X2 [Micropterus dolomieu]|uniref:period circadian protein homolog 1b isoform X2 n=1 Tax=Micropterus dolomieu TaxID=147949 RepID=UPI001E8CBAE6|nr:period circadian protein homolog 1b isoform X2 [Micropterus dolomieu]
MSYDNPKSAPSSSTRGRVARAEEKDNNHEAESEGLNSPETSGGQSGANDPTQEQGRGAGGGSSPGQGSGSGSSSRGRRGPNSDDMDGLSSGNDSGERESESGMERENSPRGRQSTRSSHSSSNGKDSGMMLETTESNKSSNSQSLSPPSSSLAYSLLSTSSEHDPPSTSGCSSNQSARVQSQKELMKAIKELKLRLPTERKAKGHASTLNALKYALQCVKQVRANKEYYHQWSVEECHGCSLDLSTFTIEELDNITSEYALKNTDTFTMAVSFLSGKVIYVSPQGSSLLRCKPECLQGTMFSDLLAPQDVSTFYSGTAPCRLPNWASCIGSASPVDCTQEKSMFCRISADRTQGREMRYYPFRLTPYQLTIRDSDLAEPQPCCLLIAERVHSGYEAPRIPADKRIFTTSHTPSCLFQEVDERAVPLLGYLPQDLVGTPTLLYIHPEDRPMMLAIHEKIFQFAGQPFEYSPLRMCARSGEYLTIDTSWSSFVNPWSRKVAFIVGRHKVRTSPLNEDVFTTPQGCEGRVTTPDVVQLSEQIHRVLVQPVHSGSSQGYSSLGSSGSRGSRRSHQQHLSASAGSSSDSNSPAMDKANAAVAVNKPMTFQQICKDVHMVKTNGQQMFIESRNRPLPRKNNSTGPATVRAVTSDPIRGLIADLTKPPKALVPAPLAQQDPPTGYSYQQINCLDSIIRYLDSCNIPNTVKRKCGSSSCTSTSDDDKQQEASGNNNDIIMEEAPTTPTLAPPTITPTRPAITPPPPPPPLPQATQPERDSRRSGSVGGRMGLTKEVLSAHTQQEEQAFLDRFKDLSKLRVFDQTASSNLHCHAPAANPLSRGVRCSRDYPAAASSSARRRGRGGKRLKHQESSDQRSSLGLSGSRGDPRTSTGPMPLNIPLGPPTNSSSWPSVGSQASIPSAPFAPGMLPIYPVYPPLAQPFPQAIPDQSRFPPSQMIPPMMALVLPNYMFPQMGAPISQPGATPGHFYNPNFPYPVATPAAVPNVLSNTVPIPGNCVPSRSSTPQSYTQTPADREGAESPLFQSRCSSPLNLLQLEESPSNRLEVATALAASQQATPSVQGGAGGGQSSTNQGSSDDISKENENGETNESNQDAMSTSSDLLDMLLQEDSRSGTGSAASGSGSSGTRSSGSGSGSNGCSSSGTSGTSSSQGSHTSKYFGSIDSSENDHSRKQPAGGSSSAGGDGGEEQFIKCVLQDPIWLLMANTDDKVMMTYQLPVRDMETVLREDREALRSMQKHQPRFTEVQKRELSQVHPWIRTGRLPRAINISGCAGCKSPTSVPPAAPFDVEIHEMELCNVLKAQEEGAGDGRKLLSETAMDEAHPDDEEEEVEEKGQNGNQDMPAEEQRATSEAVKENESRMTH